MNDDNKHIVNNGDESVDVLIHQQEFGIRLRQAREAEGYSIIEVAELLKLSEAVIRALENSQVEKLPPATFTQGYIRSYARLLKLPAEEIIDAYSQLLPETKELRSTRQGIAAEKRSGDFGFRFFSYILLIGGLVLLYLWWQQSGLDWGNKAVPDIEPVVTEAIENKTEQQLVELPSVDTSDVQVVDQQVEKEEQPLPAVIQAEQSAVSDSSPQVMIEESAPAQDIVPVGNDILVIETSSDSWTEIEDANDNRFFFKLMKQGERHTLQGQAPFRLFLGNAPSVELKINNLQVDISAHIKSNNIAYILVADNAKVNAAKKTRKIISTDTPDQQPDAIEENTESEPVN